MRDVTRISTECDGSAGEGEPGCSGELPRGRDLKDTHGSASTRVATAMMDNSMCREDRAKVESSDIICGEMNQLELGFTRLGR